MIGSSQDGFMNRKSWLTEPIAFYGKKIGLMDEGRAMDAAYLDLSKAFDTVFCNILIGKRSTD